MKEIRTTDLCDRRSCRGLGTCLRERARMRHSRRTNRKEVQKPFERSRIKYHVQEKTFNLTGVGIFGTSRLLVAETKRCSLLRHREMAGKLCIVPNSGPLRPSLRTTMMDLTKQISINRSDEL